MLDTAASIQSRWGMAVGKGTPGFTAVPTLLIRSQAQLGLSSTNLAVLLNIVSHWWRADEWPYPRPATIAKRMGVDRRTVERSFQALEAMTLIRRLPNETSVDQPAVRRIDLSGLVARLNQLAQEQPQPTSRGKQNDHSTDD